MPPAIFRPPFFARHFSPAIFRPPFFARHFSPALKFTLGLLLSLAALPSFADLPAVTPKNPAMQPAAKPAPAPVGISATHFTPKEHAALAALPPPKPAETELFAYLTKKTGRAMKLPMHPPGVSALGSWFFSRQTTSRVPAEVYPTLYENLLITRGLLQSPDINRQRVGLVVARYSGMTARLNLNDYTLDARICEAFLVPHLDIAYPEIGHTVSRRQILQDTILAYEGAKDERHELTTLLFLLRYADSPNTLNWTRLLLAQTYEQQSDFGQAIAFAKITQPLDKDWLARLQQEQAKKNPPPTPKAAAPKAAVLKGSHS